MKDFSTTRNDDLVLVVISTGAQRSGEIYIQNYWFKDFALQSLRFLDYARNDGNEFNFLNPV